MWRTNFDEISQSESCTIPLNLSENPSRLNSRVGSMCIWDSLNGKWILSTTFEFNAQIILQVFLYPVNSNEHIFHNHRCIEINPIDSLRFSRFAVRNHQSVILELKNRNCWRIGFQLQEIPWSHQVPLKFYLKFTIKDLQTFSKA